MKKLSGLIIFLFCAVVSFSQSGFPNNQTISNGSTLYHAKGGLVGDSGLVLGSFPDTSVANRGPFLKGTDGLMIRVADTIFMRVVAKSAWVNVSGTGGGGGGGSGVQNVTYANGILCVYKTADTTCYTIRDYTIDSITVNADTTQYIAWNGGNTLFYFPTLMRTVTGIYPLSVLRVSSDSFQIRCLTCNTLRDGLIQGGNISWSGTGLTYNITPALYVINGIQYSSPAGSFTLSDGDASFDRIDLIVLDSTGSVVVIPGTPAANPQFPQTTSPSSQLAINNFLVKSGATLPTGVTQTIIYDEQSAGEWSAAVQSGLVVNFGNTVNPFHLTKSADVGTWPTNRTITFTNVDKLDRNDYTILKMYIKLKAPLPSTANIQVLFQNGTVATTTTYFSLSTTHGFSKTVPDYQNITIPLAGIAFTSNIFDKVSIRFTGVGSGVYLDYIQLQGGISNGSSDFVENVFKRNDSLFQVKGGVPLFVTKISNGGITSPQAFLAGVLDSIATPVALPRNGSIYQVASAGLTGVFVGHPNQIATYDSVAGIYNFITADTGNLINNASNYVISQYTGVGWVRVGYMPLFQGGNDFKNPVVAGSKDSSNFEFRTIGQTRMTLDRISKYLLLSKGTGIGFYGEGGQPTAKLWFSDPTTSIYANGGDFNFETGLGRFVFYNSTGSVPQVQFRENFNWLKFKTKIADTYQQPHVSSIFDIESTTKGVLVPRMTAAQRLAIGGDITSGTLTAGGSGYTDGSYPFNPLTNLTGSGSGAQVNIVVSGGTVTAVNLIGGGGGQQYQPSNTLSSATIGPGTGFVYTVNTLGSRGLLVWDTDSLSLFQYTGSAWQNLYNLGGGGGGSYTASNGLSLSGSDIQLGGTLAAPTSIDLNSNQFSLVRGAYNALSFDPAHDTITIRHITGTGAESVVKLADDNGYTAQVELRAVDPANGGYGSLSVGPGGFGFGGTSTGDQRSVSYSMTSGGVQTAYQNTSSGSSTTLLQGIETGDHPYVEISSAQGGGSQSSITVKDTAININTPILRINGVLYGSGGGGGGNTIYTADDALTGSRSVDLAGNALRFRSDGIERLLIEPAGSSELTSYDTTDNDSYARVILSADPGSSTGRIKVDFNDGTNEATILANANASTSSISYSALSHVFNGTVTLNTVASGASTDSVLTQDVSTGEVRRRSSSFLSSTFQQTLNNGSQLTKNDTVDVNGFAFRFNNGATPILSMLSTGLTGINKTTPTEALDVTGNILGSGTILGTGRVSGGTASMTSAQAATELSDETGSASGGLAVYNNTPTIIAPNIGDATTSTIGINSAVSTNTAIMYLSPVSSNATPLLYLRPSTGGTVAPAVVLNTSPTSATNSNSFSIGTGNATLPANTWNLASTLSGNASANSWPIGFLVSNTASGRFTAMTVANSGGIGIGLTAPLARLHVTSGTTSANTAPLMLAGVAPALNTTPQKYAVEVDTATGGGNIYYSNALATRYTLAKTLTTTSTLNFASTAAGTNSDLTITVTGAADGDAVSLGVQNAAVNANSSFTAFVSAANTVTVRFNNYQAAGAIDPASATFRVSVIKY